MSIRMVLEEVVRPYLDSIETENVSQELDRIEREVRLSGALVPSIASGLEADDLKSTDLPPAVRKILADEIRKDVSRKSQVSNDPHSQLRPVSFDHVVGHAKFKKLMLQAILAAKRTNTAIRHILLTGPRGLGKTTLALAIAHERGVDVRVLVGRQLQAASDITAEVLRWKDHEIIFIDEIHGMSKAAQEMLFSVMEDGRLSVVTKQGKGTVKTSVAAPRVTIIGATTDPAKLLGPFRNRFGIQYTLDFYSAEEMTQIGRRSCQILGFTLESAGMTLLIKNCRDNPRTLNELLLQMRDLSVAEDCSLLTTDDVDGQLELAGYENGLRTDERRYIECLARAHGQIASLTTLAKALDIQEGEVSQTIEPWLIRQGFVGMTPRGRKLVVNPMNKGE